MEKRYRHLAILLLAALAAILVADTDRMTAFLRKPRIVHDPGLDRPCRGHRWQYRTMHRSEQRLLVPWRLADKVQQ